MSERKEIPSELFKNHVRKEPKLLSASNVFLYMIGFDVCWIVQYT